MNKILINKSGVPVVIDTLDSTLFDESRHIQFEKPNNAMTQLYSIEYHSGRTLDHITKWKPIGQIFDIPKGYDIEIIECLPPIANLKPSEPENSAQEEPEAVTVLRWFIGNYSPVKLNAYDLYQIYLKSKAKKSKTLLYGKDKL